MVRERGEREGESKREEELAGKDGKPEVRVNGVAQEVLVCMKI